MLTHAERQSLYRPARSLTAWFFLVYSRLVPPDPRRQCWIEVPRLPASVLAKYRRIHDLPPFDEGPVKIAFGIELEGRMFYYARMRSGLLKRASGYPSSERFQSQLTFCTLVSGGIFHS